MLPLDYVFILLKAHFNKTKLSAKANSTVSKVQDFACYDAEIEKELTHHLFAQIGKA